MKRTTLTIITILSTVIAIAAPYQIGDYVETDSIPGLVVAVDSTGEHGLIMSVPALRSQDADQWLQAAQQQLQDQYAHAKKYAIRHQNRKKGFRGDTAQVDSIYTIQSRILTHMAAMPRLPHHAQLTEQQWREHIQPMVESSNENGIHNQQAITHYCAEHGLFEGMYFPETYWASLLGEGWFIPGTAELEQVATAIYGGVGREHRIPAKYRTKRKRVEHVHEPLLKRYDRVSYARYGSFIRNTDYQSLFPLKVMSSTPVGCNWGKEHKHMTRTTDNDYAARYYSMDIKRRGWYFIFSTANDYQVIRENGQIRIPLSVCAFRIF